MQVRVLARAARVLLGDRPADVVVAAHVGDPARAGRDGRHRLQRVGEQRRRAGGERAPAQDHEHVVVGEVALLALVPARAEVAHELARGDDRLGLERDAGGRDPQRGAERLQQLVDLGLVLAVGALALPQERHRVEPQHVDAGRGEVEHRLGHRPEDRGVGVVEVPLEVVERRPHPAAELLDVGEVPGRDVGEDLGQRRLVGVGLRAVAERAVVRELVGVAVRAPPAPTRARARCG